MLSVAALFIVSTSHAQINGQTQSLQCQGTQNQIATSLVLKISGDVIKLQIYQSVNRRATAAPRVVLMRELPGTRGPVVAYGDLQQRTTLVLNLHDRVGNGSIRARFVDNGRSTLEVLCK